MKFLDSRTTERTSYAPVTHQLIFHPCIIEHNSLPEFAELPESMAPDRWRHNIGRGTTKSY